MGIRIKEVINNQTGGSLALVLIIGMIIMIMVASLLAVANSDFTFTQETVESRQAYIDAKSVIEYGKIEINERMKTLDAKNQELKTLYDQLAALTERGAIAAKETEINNKIAEINRYVDGDLSAPYYIGGVENNIAKTPTETSDQTSAVGVLSVTKVSLPNNPGVTTYTFDIKTQNLRRKLDYKVPFNYGVQTTTGGSVTPILPDDTWKGYTAHIQKTGNSLNMVFHPDKNEREKNGVIEVIRAIDLDIGGHPGQGGSNSNTGYSEFDWLPNKTLDLDVKNVRFSTSIPSTGTQGSTFDIKAGNVIFEHDLIISDQTIIIIDCETLWIKGDVNIDPKSLAYISNIKANNIIVEGNITIGNNTTVIWNCAEKFWCMGSLKTNAEASLGSIIETNKYIGGAGGGDAENETVAITISKLPELYY